MGFIVKKITSRAAGAARDTTDQIDQMSQNFLDAMKMVLESVEKFAKVDENTRIIIDFVAEIAVASKVKSEEIGQIINAVTRMGKVVQHNAANLE